MGLNLSKGLQESYEALANKDDETLYICTDSGNAYIGTQLIDKKYIDTQINNIFASPAAVRDTLDVLSSEEIANAISNGSVNYADSAGGVDWANVSGKPTSFPPANHDANKITSGTLPVTHGGTGLTASPSMTVNLASNVEADVFAASPSPGVTGTLPVANGGTGTTTFTSGAALIGNGTGAITTRGITNNTSLYGSFSGNNLITADTLRYALNRTNSVARDNADYETYMARGEAIFLNTANHPLYNGTIAWFCS